jgi:hypothetical protein
MLSVVMLNVANNAFMLSVILLMLSVILLCVFTLNLVMPNAANNEFMLSVLY